MAYHLIGCRLRVVWYTICLQGGVAMQISTGLRELLEQRLASLEQVQIVLLLRRDPSRSWTAPEVARELGSAPEPAAMRLFLLASSGLIAFEAVGLPRYRYDPADPRLDALLGELSAVCDHDLEAITALVEAPPPDPIRSFADAFKLRR